MARGRESVYVETNEKRRMKRDCPMANSSFSRTAACRSGSPHEKGYFRDEGLDYEFVRGPSADTQKPSMPPAR